MPSLAQAALRFRAEILAHEEAAASRMVQVYGQAWTAIQYDLDTLQQQAQEARDAGREVGPGWLYREQRLTTLRGQVEAQLREFSIYADAAITQTQARAVQAAQSHALQLMRQALPGEVRAGINFAHVPTAAVEDLAGHLSNGSPLKAILDKLPKNGGEAVQKHLTAGLATGQQPAVTAGKIREALGGDLTRALTISRTETMRAYRESSRRTYAANDELYTGWIWVAAFSARTCAACLAMSGTEHSWDEPLDGHPNCRCTMVPKRKSLAELGFPDVPDTRPTFQTGGEWLEKQPPEKQEQILGKAGAAAYQAGDVQLSDFVGQRHSEEWGSMRYERSLKGALAAAAE